MEDTKGLNSFNFRKIYNSEEIEEVNERSFMYGELVITILLVLILVDLYLLIKIIINNKLKKKVDNELYHIGKSKKQRYTEIVLLLCLFIVKVKCEFTYHSLRIDSKGYDEVFVINLITLSIIFFTSILSEYIEGRKILFWKDGCILKINSYSWNAVEDYYWKNKMLYIKLKNIGFRKKIGIFVENDNDIKELDQILIQIGVDKMDL